MYINPFTILVLALSFGLSISFICIICNFLFECCFLKCYKAIKPKEEEKEEEEEKKESEFVIIINPGKNPISLGKI